VVAANLNDAAFAFGMEFPEFPTWIGSGCVIVLPPTLVSYCRFSILKA